MYGARGGKEHRCNYAGSHEKPSRTKSGILDTARWQMEEEGQFEYARNANRQAGANRPYHTESSHFETSKELHVVKNFEEMCLKEDLLRGIYAYGFEKPSAIQQRAVLPLIQGD